MHHDRVAVVDFGGQYAHLIATKVRRLNVLAEIRQPEDPIEAFAPYRAIILSGSPSLSSHGEDSDYTRALYDLDVPILGFCFGHQEIAKQYGGTVVNGGREWGKTELHVLKPHPLFEGVPAVDTVWMSHFDSVTEVGPGFEELATSTVGPDQPVHRFAALGNDTLKRYGFQFHPEVDDSVHGSVMIANFLFRIAGVQPTWTMERYLEERVEALKQQVGDRSVFLLASGGVDSTVAARLLGQALGPERLHLLHVDNGLMRKGESRQVLQLFGRLGLAKNLHFVDATSDFLGACAGLAEPEAKRRAIGETFITVFEREARRHGLQMHLLGQGTIYPDTIETGGTKRADTIKTHHNRVPVIDEMIRAGRVVEPLVDLYKVEVRELGEKLGIPHEALWRHPFPGPGLGVRCLCSAAEVSDAEIEALRAPLSAVAERHGLEARPLPIRSVGVKADLRSYEHPALLQGYLPWERLIEAVGAILKDVPGLNRCVWNLGPRLPVKARVVPAFLTRERLELLREADGIVMDGLKRYELYDEIWQCPTVLLPLELDGRGADMLIVRPVLSERAMTAQPAPLPDELLAELTRDLMSLPGISGLGLDLTSKPPGTIEWE
jgi:GMP synthase (glutamine-hydrolysing)